MTTEDQPNTAVATAVPQMSLTVLFLRQDPPEDRLQTAFHLFKDKRSLLGRYSHPVGSSSTSGDTSTGESLGLVADLKSESFQIKCEVACKARFPSFSHHMHPRLPRIPAELEHGLSSTTGEQTLRRE